MLMTFAKRIFGSANERYIKSLAPLVDKINALEADMQALSDTDLRAKTDAFRSRYQQGESLDKLLVEAFATVREAAKRTLGQRHYDVQLIGGIILHRGKIAEMKTGEGKTLVATLAVYLNALSGRGVHVITVNDYLAERDAAWMGEVYRFLGMRVGCILAGLDNEERRDAYNADITYGTNNEFGFDYLRDNLKFQPEAMVQRDFNFAIVDEVDSILIDEARTPLIISGAAEDSSDMYRQVDTIIPEMVEADYEMDEKARSITFTDTGVEHVEELLGARGLLEEGSLYDVQNVNLLHHATQGLRAHKLFKKDKDYIVKDDAIVLIDEFTGRMMEGRTLSEGLHQAIEAKEGVTIRQENQTVASITYQNYFRMYDKLAGMTGTAMTEASEFDDIYKMEVVAVPTNLPVTRIDQHDEVYRTAQEKYDAVIEQIEACRKKEQPVLVGTVSIEKSEYLASVLQKKKIPHQVLNARFHEQEAKIIAQAGVPGAVTIATNMAGRGTDIQLGGNADMRISEEASGDLDETSRAAKITQIRKEIAGARQKALQAGGLYVLGTERHESRRIDNQLRGRSGRQGDPGESKFFISLEDDLMRIFGGDRLDNILQTLGLEEGMAIVHPWVNKALERAQQRVEARNYEVRKNLLKFDDVMNDQRKVIYDQRKEFLRAEDLHDSVREMRHDVISDIVARAIPPKAYPDQWDSEGLHAEAMRLLKLDLPIADWVSEEGIADQEITTRIRKASDEQMAAKFANYGNDVMKTLEKQVLVNILDREWKDHLQTLSHLRQGIGWRAYSQRDPLNEYKRESFELFDQMLQNVRAETTRLVTHLEVQQPSAEEFAALRRREAALQEIHQDPAQTLATAGGAATPPPASGGAQAMAASQQMTGAAASSGAPQAGSQAGASQNYGKVPRNAPCPCGSGKKFKHCHGRLA